MTTISLLLLCTRMVIQWIRLLCSPIYILLSSIAILSTISPFLRDLASHGKTRSTFKEKSNNYYIPTSQPQSLRKKLYTQPFQYLRYTINKYSHTLSSICQYFIHDERWLVPKTRFVDFYIVGCIGTVLLHVLLPTFHQFHYLFLPQHEQQQILPQQPMQIDRLVCTTLLIIHLSRRWYECKHVHVWNKQPLTKQETTKHNEKAISSSTTSSKMHLGGYLLGMLHYTLLPFVFLNNHDNYCCSDNNRDLSTSNYCSDLAIAATEKDTASYTTCTHILTQVYSNDYYEFYIIVILAFGVLLNVIGQVQQYHHHSLLANCRQRDGSNATNSDDNNDEDNDDKHDYNRDNGETKQRNTHCTRKTTNEKKSSYTIPQGAWFQYVSCPHYLAEILIYISFAIMLHIQEEGSKSTIQGGIEGIDMEYCSLLEHHDVCFNSLDSSSSLGENNHNDDDESCHFNWVTWILLQYDYILNNNPDLLLKAHENLHNIGSWSYNTILRSSYILVFLIAKVLLWLKSYIHVHVALVVWVTINLAVSARANHQWYHETFNDYPKERKAMIPFLW